MADQHEHHWVPKREGSVGDEPAYVQACACGAEYRFGMVLDPSATVRKGARVRLLYVADTYTKLQPGDEGTVRFVDSTGTTHVAWDSGSSLGMVPGEDSFEVIPS